MLKKLSLVVLPVLAAVLLTAGCETMATGGAAAAKPSHEILRKSVIGTDWQMYQIRLLLPAGSSFPVLLKLAPGDKVDGYFYLEKGSNVDFGVNADAQVFRSTPNASGVVSTDRFSFTAAKELGSTYSLQFAAAGNATEQEVVFLELMYPVNGGIYVPLETK